MAVDRSTGFPDPDGFSTVNAPLPQGFVAQPIPLTPVPANQPPAPAQLPPMQQAQQASVTASVQRTLAQERTGVRNLASQGYGNAVIVAASDATVEEKATAKYICDGWADQAEINNAFLEGPVKLTSGTYIITDNITGAHSLIGMGESTIIKLADSAPVFSGNVAIITVGVDQTYSDFVIDGNKANQTETHRGFMGSGSNCIFQNIRVHDVAGHGIFLQPGVSDSDLKIKAVTAEDCGQSGIVLSTGTFSSHIPATLEHITSLGNTLSGVQILLDGTLLNGFNVALNGAHGVHISGANYVRLTNGTVSANSQTTDNAADNINLTSADWCAIENVTNIAGSEANAPRYGVNIANAASEDNLVMCEFPDGASFGTDEIGDSGTRTRFIPTHTHANTGQGGQIAAASVTIADAGNDFTATTVEGALDELQADAEADAQALTDHLNDATDAHDASAISVLDSGGNYTATDVEAALAEVMDALQAHEADTSDAHDASAVSIVDLGAYYTGTEVEAALQEAGADIASAASDASTALGNIAAHIGDTSDAHDATAISIVDAGGHYSTTTVEGALAEIGDDLAAHLTDTSDAHDASAVSVADSGGYFTATDVEAALQEIAQSTRSLTFGMGDFAAMEGAPARTSYRTSATTTQGFNGWAFDATTVEMIGTMFRLPDDWVSGTTVEITFLIPVAAGASQDVRWAVRMGAASAGDAFPGTGAGTDSVGATVSVASGAQWTVYSQSFAVAPSGIAAGDSIFLNVQRDASNAADDYGSDAVLIGVRMTYLGTNNA